MNIFILKGKVPDPMFLIIGEPVGVLNRPKGPVKTGPFPGPKKRSDQTIDRVGSIISLSVVISQYGRGVRQAVSILYDTL